MKKIKPAETIINYELICTKKYIIQLSLLLKIIPGMFSRKGLKKEKPSHLWLLVTQLVKNK
jgi:hypothetical protein